MFLRPLNFCASSQAICRRHGILLVTDEVQSGMGRTGKWWAADHAGSMPDIFARQKASLRACRFPRSIANASVMDWPPGSHASTFGGNPVCVAAALVTLRLLETEYIANARRIGEYIFGRLAGWPGKFRIVGDVRGQGLMIGIEIVKDQDTKERAPWPPRCNRGCRVSPGLADIGFGRKYAAALTAAGDRRGTSGLRDSHA